MPAAVSQSRSTSQQPRMALATVPGVEIFATGEFNGERWTLRDLAEIARNFNELGPAHKNLLRSPVVLGHEENQDFLERTDLPAAGWPSRVWIKPYRDPNTGAMEGILKADFAEVPKPIAGLINSRAYRKVSAEIYDDFKDDFGRSHGKALRRISLLGGEIPKVKRLADIPLARFSEGSHPPRLAAIKLIRLTKSPRRGTVFCFSELVELAEWSPYTNPSNGRTGAKSTGGRVLYGDAAQRALASKTGAGSAETKTSSGKPKPIAASKGAVLPKPRMMDEVIIGGNDHPYQQLVGTVVGTRPDGSYVVQEQGNPKSLIPVHPSKIKILSNLRPEGQRVAKLFSKSAMTSKAEVDVAMQGLAKLPKAEIDKTYSAIGFAGKPKSKAAALIEIRRRIGY